MRLTRTLPIPAICAILIAVALGSVSAGSSLKADFNYSVEGKKVSFSDRSTGINIQKWLWDFGDRSYSQLRNPVHVYAGVGTYKVVLQIVSASGNMSTKIQNITLSRTNGTLSEISVGELLGISLAILGFGAIFVVRTTPARIVVAIVGLLGILMIFVSLAG